MPRLYIPDISIVNNQITIMGEKARYIISILRCKKGDELNVFDGKGNCQKTRILKAGRKEVIVEVLEKFLIDTESQLHITLIQALLKGEKMDLVIQKTTELGVKEIIPVITERSQLQATRKFDRWRKIAEEASRQSGRSVIPVIREPINFRNVFTTYSSKEKFCGFIFYEEGGMRLSEAMGKVRIYVSFPVHIAIGPEGGFTIEEIALAKEKGLIVVSFGERILRAETAAISSVTVVQFLLGDIG